MADPVVVLRRRFPGLVFWFGRCTGAWWALIPAPCGWRLVEAADPEQLTRAVIEAQSWLAREAVRELPETVGIVR